MLSAVVLLSFFAMLSPQQLFLYLFFAVSIVWNRDVLYDGIFKHPLRIPLLLTLFSLFATAFLNGEGGKGVYNAGRFFMENYAYLTVAFVGGLACSLDVFGRCAVCRAKRSGCFLVESFCKNWSRCISGWISFYIFLVNGGESDEEKYL